MEGLGSYSHAYWHEFFVYSVGVLVWRLVGLRSSIVPAAGLYLGSKALPYIQLLLQVEQQGLVSCRQGSKGLLAADKVARVS